MTGLSPAANRFLRKLVDLPRYGPLPLRDPQQQVAVRLEGLAEPLDVTRNNVVVALRPFTIGIMRPAGSEEVRDGLRLCMYERDGSGRLLGSIRLRPSRRIELPEHRFCLFETEACENFCVGAPSLALYNLREKWRAELRQRKNPYNFRMTQTDLRCSHVFYICPRPVVLVSVEHDGASNLFPMDLIGPTDSRWFSMALRSTSPAVRLMQQSRRMALASSPWSFKEIAYDLGKHHRLPAIDTGTLPFPTMPSPAFGLPVPKAALKIREVRVAEFHEVGSHVLFVTSVERETVLSDGLQLFHNFGSYRWKWIEET